MASNSDDVVSWDNPTVDPSADDTFLNLQALGIVQPSGEIGGSSEGPFVLIDWPGLLAGNAGDSISYDDSLAGFGTR